MILDLRGGPEDRGFGDDAKRLVEGGCGAAKWAEVDPALLPQRPIENIEQPVMFLDRAQAGDWRSRFDMKEREAAIAPLRRHLTGVELLAVVPIVGVMSLFGEGKPLPLFGLFEIPSPWPKDKAFTEHAEEIHERGYAVDARAYYILCLKDLAGTGSICSACSIKR